MANTTKKSFTKSKDVLLLILCIIPFGFDKLYKKAPKMFLYKLLLHFVGVGLVWWVFDIVCAFMDKYKVNPLK